MIDILRLAVKQGASDVHLLIGRPPMTRVHGEVLDMPGLPALTSEEAKRLIYSMLYDEQKQKFEQNLELDCSFSIAGLARFRVNVLMQINGIEAVLRVIAS
ncbi:MAG TPA: type IV pili twitching motility protein PilT, partial [Elusimicrobiota bacterium]|nr:type IV pili twitching motility protein PilT [Elusimicrobiota bacterium]